MSQIICPISGITMIQAPYMLGFSMQEKHPIFRMKRKDLITDKIAHRFSRATSLEEKKLYFLAVLHSTDLVTFHHIASPSLKTIEKNFYTALNIAGWIDYAMYKYGKEVSFPRYIVREENKEMENISCFLEEVSSLRDSFNKKSADRELLNSETQRIQKELSKAFLKDTAFTPYSAKWTLEATGLDSHPKAALFTKILNIRLADAPTISKDLLDELYELIMDEMDMNHPLASPILGQLRQITDAHKKGFSFEILDEEVEVVDDETGKISTERVPLASVYKEKLLKEMGNLEEPKEKDFIKKIDFLKAHAKWTIVMKAEKDGGQNVHSI